MSNTEGHAMKPMSLVGMFFHIWKDEKIDRQGHVVRQVAAETYLIQYFEFLMGTATNFEVVALADMLHRAGEPRSWTFYETAEDMRDAWDDHAPLFKRRWEEQQQAQTAAGRFEISRCEAGTKGMSGPVKEPQPDVAAIEVPRPRLGYPKQGPQQ